MGTMSRAELRGIKCDVAWGDTRTGRLKLLSPHDPHTQHRRGAVRRALRLHHSECSPYPQHVLQCVVVRRSRDVTHCVAVTVTEMGLSVTPSDHFRGWAFKTARVRSTTSPLELHLVVRHDASLEEPVGQ
jgi:hypothetical protein